MVCLKKEVRWLPFFSLKISNLKTEKRTNSQLDFRSGGLRMVFPEDQSLFVGETNRGWGSAGDANEGFKS